MNRIDADLGYYPRAFSERWQIFCLVALPYFVGCVGKSKIAVVSASFE